VDWTDDAAHQLEALTGDPLADAVRGIVRITAASAPEGRRRYQECRLEMQAEAPEIEPRTVRTVAVFDTRSWPAAGAVLPARISRSHADAVEVDWDALAR
jgi:hypothetical protein